MARHRRFRRSKRPRGAPGRAPRPFNRLAPSEAAGDRLSLAFFRSPLISPIDTSRRRVVLGAALLFHVPSLLASPTRIEVWKAAQCGCCKDWIAHLESQGFSVTAHDDGNADARTRLRIPQQLASCHTAFVDGYAIEGHVPARDIRRLLAERPRAVGLAAPGMPIGSPGMDRGADRGSRAKYDVLLVLQGGATRVYQSYR
jgi:hypothetical protein